VDNEIEQLTFFISGILSILKIVSGKQFWGKNMPIKSV